MSDAEGRPGNREVAYRVFAAEYDDADLSYSESDEERAPNYVVTPTGARANRLFLVGVLTEVTQVSDEVLRARVVDQTGPFMVYAGQYQPDALSFVERTDPPAFVAVTGKARTFQPDDSDTVYTSVRPESINAVDADTRDRWTVGTARRTLDRVGTVVDALDRDARGEALQADLVADGAPPDLAEGVALAVDHYGTTPAYLAALRDLALDAARVVAGDRDEVRPLDVAPDESGTVTLADLAWLRERSAAATADSGPAASAESGTATSADTGATTSADTEAATSADSGNPTADEDGETPSDTTTEASAAETATEASAGETAADASTGETATDASTETATADVDPDSATGEDASTPEASPGASETAVESTGDATATSAADETDDDIGDFEPGEFELEDEERERIEDEYGTEFETGTEVGDPGDADIETPEPTEGPADEPSEESAGESTEESAAEEPATGASAVEESPSGEPAAEASGAEESGAEESKGEGSAAEESAEESAAEESADDAAAAEDVDPVDAVMDAMEALDDGDGADRSAVVERVSGDLGLAEDDVEDAIQEALMDGRCYEPDDETLKPI